MRGGGGLIELIPRLEIAYLKRNAHQYKRNSSANCPPPSKERESAPVQLRAEGNWGMRVDRKDTAPTNTSRQRTELALKGGTQASASKSTPGNAYR